jgi:prepilin-type N-terminal cleavage/methylation domain-containing protein
MLVFMKQLKLSCDARERRAFTLVELLVVVTLVLVIAGIGVMFVPNMADQQRAAEGGSQVQGWLNIAKQRALRDQAPRGIRFYPNSANVAVEAVYIDQPDDLIGTAGSVTVSGTAGTSSLTLSGLDISNGGQPQNLWSVLQGDYIELLGTGLVYQLDTPAGALTTYTLGFAAQTNGVKATLPFTINSTGGFRIIRQPRVSGEEKLMLPANVGVDLTGTLSQFSGTAGNPLDILFAPSGNVIAGQAGQAQVILWVYDTTLPQKTANAGEPTLIVVNVRSGMVAAVPVDSSNAFATPYSFKDKP